MDNKKKSPWNYYDTLEGPALILGRAFDFEAAIVLDQANQMIVIKVPYPSRETDEEYPYPKMDLIVLPISQMKELLEKENDKEKEAPENKHDQ